MSIPSTSGRETIHPVPNWLDRDVKPRRIYDLLEIGPPEASSGDATHEENRGDDPSYCLITTIMFIEIFD